MYLLHQSVSFKDIPRSHTLCINFTCCCCIATYHEESEKHFFVRAFEHLCITPLTGKQVKNPKKSANL